MPSELSREKKKKFDDPRMGCELCLMNYGMESMPHGSICASRNCLAVIAGWHRKPAFLLIFPKKHEMKMDRIKKDPELYKEIRRLIRRTEARLKEMYGAKKIETTWCNGGILLYFGGLSLKGTNSHAHCKMNVQYK